MAVTEKHITQFALPKALINFEEKMDFSELSPHSDVLDIGRIK